MHLLRALVISVIAVQASAECFEASSPKPFSTTIKKAHTPVSDGSGVRQPGCIVETANGRLGYVAYDYICKMPNTEQVELQPKYGCCDTGPDSGDLVCTVRANQWGGLSKIRAAGLGLSPVKLDRRAIADLVNVFKGDLNFHEALAGLTLVKYVLDPSFRAETNSIRQELQAIAQNKNLPVDKRGNVAYVLLHYPNLSEQEERQRDRHSLETKTRGIERVGACR
jgi:hypothetical protein